MKLYLLNITSSVFIIFCIVFIIEERADTMKISEKIQSQSVTQPQLKIEGNQTFNQIVQSKTKQLKHQEIQYFMKEITLQGERLARFRSFQDLLKFKRLVKEFLKKTVYNGLDVKKSHHFSFDGQGQKLAIVEEVDEKLMKLTGEIMNQEEKTVNILGLIGEIKGLLINLYT